MGANIIAALVSAILGGSGLSILIIWACQPSDIAYIKYATRRNKEIDPFAVDNRPHEEKIKKILNKRHYILKEIERIEEKTIIGFGQTKYNDGTCTYSFYTSKNCFQEVSKEDYKNLKKYLGKTIKIRYVDKKWVKEGR